MDDPYDALGVQHDVSQDGIRIAFRNLAKKHHPDLNPGDKRAEERFKTISAANELLSVNRRRTLTPDRRATLTPLAQLAWTLQ